MERLIFIFYRFRGSIFTFTAVVLFNYALADIAVRISEHLLQPEAPKFSPQRKAKQGSGRQSSLTELKAAILKGPLFPNSDPGDGAENKSDIDSNSLPQASVQFEKLGLVLTGTVTGPSWFSRAYIKSARTKDENLKNGRAFKLGQVIDGAKLTWISRDKVYLLYDNNKEVLYLYPQEEKKESRNGSVPSLKSGKTIKKVMSKGDLNKKIFNNLNNIMKGIAVKPYFKGGKMDGYLIKKIKRTNVLHSLGARSGDIVKAVNDHKINDIKKVLKLWEGMREERQIKVDILRRGQIVTYDFEIRE